MSSSRAAALASAAIASSRLAMTYPKASPIPTALLSHPPRRYADRKGKRREQEQESVLEEHFVDDGLSSRQRRLSRAARFATNNDSTFTNLPKEWTEMVDGVVNKSHKAIIQTDYQAKLKDLSAGKLRSLKDPNRATALHLTTESPFRYAALISVLRQVRNRLGPDQEDLAKDNRRTWTPTRIVEYFCGAGEGLWAAKEVFGSEKENGFGFGIRSYLGVDQHVPLLRCAIDFVKQTAPKPESESAEDNQLREKKPSFITFYGIDAFFKPQANSPVAIDGLKYQKEDFSQPDDRGTMVICSYALLYQYADAHRARFIRTIWNAHPSAEVIVFIEKAHERGFAALASVREYILGIGAKDFPKETLGFQIKHPTYRDRGLLDEEDLVEAAKGVSGEWHVVAPCPHDKPCPLLHDYDFAGPANNPTTRTSSASSPLFHGSPLGMTTCSFNSRLLRPESTRYAMNQKEPEAAVDYSYLVLRRGPRPSIASEARLISEDETSFVAQRDQMRRASQNTKLGDIEEIRAGSKRDSVPLAEEIGEEETGEAALGNFDDDTAREELLKLLPETLGRDLNSKQGDETAEMDEAMRLAHEMMEKSANSAKPENQDESVESDEQSNLLITSAFLNQAGNLNSTVDEDVKKPLQSSDIEAMNIESYEWPRVIRPAIKKSGHVTFDVCSSYGSIDRFTVPKSSGKQIYQDARKSNYGDLFPHVAFSDEEGVQASIKSQITQVPSAGTERSGLPANFKTDRFTARKRLKKGEGRGDMPSYKAIGADRVSPKTGKSTGKHRAKTLRDHTKGNKGRRRSDESSGEDDVPSHKLTPRQELLLLD